MDFDQDLQRIRERKHRRDAARAAVLRLPSGDRRDFLLEMLLEIEEATVAKTASGETSESEPAPMLYRSQVKFVDRAESYVRAHKEGVTTGQVADAIGQEPNATDGTLRHVLRTRKTIERREGRWFPVETAKPSGPIRTIRDAIRLALTPSLQLGTSDIFVLVEKLMPGSEKPSVTAEVARMKKDGLLVEVGAGPRGGIYTLAKGGGQTT